MKIDGVTIGDMAKSTYDPNLDGKLALAQLVDAVCSETEADSKITAQAAAAVGAAGLVLASGKNVKVEETLGTDHTWSGITCDGTAGENLVFPDLCYLKISDGKFWKADADAAATTEGLLAICTETINADGTGVFLLIGYLRDDTHNWATQGAIFVHTTAGAMTQVAPSGSGDQVRKVGYPLTADVMWFSPDSTIVEI